MRCVAFGVISCFFLAACGGGVDATRDGGDGDGLATDASAADTCEDTAGSRLHPVRVTTSDGTRQRWEWADMERGERCVFAPSGDAQIRCWPIREHATVSALRYVDAGCTQPVVELPSCTNAARYVSIQTDGCFVGGELRALGAPGPVVPLYRMDAGACVRAGGGGSRVPYAVGAPIPWTSFVGATEIAGGATRLSAPGLRGEDGSVQGCADQSRTTYDGTLLTRCFFSWAADGAIRCLPSSALWTIQFTDDACTSPALSVAPVCAITPGDYYTEMEPTLCNAQVVYALAPTDTVFTRDPGTGICGAAGAPSPDIRAVGAEISPGTFEKLTVVPGVPGRRLNPRKLVAADGFAQFLDSFEDGDLGGIRCYPRVAADGRLRCVPLDVRQVQLAYTSADCTGAQVRAVAVQTCDLSPVAVASEVIADTCPATSRYFHLGAETPAFTGTPGACTPLAQVSETAYLIGAEIPVDSLAELTETIDP